MKKYIIIAVTFVILLAAAVLGYNYLSERYQPDDTMSDAQTAAQSGSDTADASDATKPVRTADDFTVLDMSGNKVKLSDKFGKPIVINFWATWCAPCKSELAAFNKLSTENGDVEFLMVNLTDGQRDTVNSVKKFIADAGYTLPVYFDTSSAAANSYKVSSIPMTVFIEKNGAVTDSHLGAMSEAVLQKYIDTLLGGTK